MHSYIFTVLAVGMGGIATLANAADVHHVDQKALNFSTPFITITPGDKITFSNSDKVNHWIVSSAPDYPIDSGDMAPGVNKTITFSKFGAVDLQCNYHSEMTMTVFIRTAKKGK